MRIVVFNASAGTSGDMAEEIAHELREHCDQDEMPRSLQAFLEHHGRWARFGTAADVRKRRPRPGKTGAARRPKEGRGGAESPAGQATLIAELSKRATKRRPPPRDIKRKPTPR